jgi:hypothetical protein
MGSPSALKKRAMLLGAVRMASSFMRPLQVGHARTSTSNVRFRSSAHGRYPHRLGGAPVTRFADAPARLAGLWLMRARQGLLGTPDGYRGWRRSRDMETRTRCSPARSARPHRRRGESSRDGFARHARLLVRLPVPRGAEGGAFGAVPSFADQSGSRGACFGGPRVRGVRCGLSASVMSRGMRRRRGSCVRPR